MIPTPWGGEIHFRTSTTSTMDDAQVLEDAGAPEGSVAWAEHQTAGRGRHPGRRWQSSPGASLLFTLYLDASRFVRAEFAPSLTIGLGVCLWLEGMGACSPPLGLKWPNDVYYGDRKLAGILVRRRLTGKRRWHIGVGINLRSPESGEDFRTSPTSVADAGYALSPPEALEGLLPCLARALLCPDPRSLCAERLYRRGEPLTLSLPSGLAVEGVPLDLDPTGALVWQQGGAIRTLSSAE